MTSQAQDASDLMLAASIPTVVGLCLWVAVCSIQF